MKRIIDVKPLRPVLKSIRLFSYERQPHFGYGDPGKEIPFYFVRLNIYNLILL